MVVHTTSAEMPPQPITSLLGLSAYISSTPEDTSKSSRLRWEHLMDEETRIPVAKEWRGGGQNSVQGRRYRKPISEDTNTDEQRMHKVSPVQRHVHVFQDLLGGVVVRRYANALQKVPYFLPRALHLAPTLRHTQRVTGCASRSNRESVPLKSQAPVTARAIRVQSP